MHSIACYPGTITDTERRDYLLLVASTLTEYKQILLKGRLAAGGSGGGGGQTRSKNDTSPR